MNWIDKTENNNRKKTNHKEISEEIQRIEQVDSEQLWPFLCKCATKKYQRTYFLRREKVFFFFFDKSALKVTIPWIKRKKKERKKSKLT